MNQSTTAQRLPFSVASLLLVGGACLLACIGLIVLTSAGQSAASDTFALAQKQLVWLVLALGAGVFAWRFPLNWLRAATPMIGLAALAFLVLVLVPGISQEINGARRWLSFGPLAFQVSELGKLALVLFLAEYFARNPRQIGKFWRGFAIPGLAIGLIFGLIMKQPDYGTAALCAVVGGSLMFIAGVSWAFLLPAAGIGLAGFAWLIWTDPVRLERITAFLDVQGNQADGAYQLVQGLIGFGVGGVEGVGLGNGRQQQFFLPEAHNDFIFAVIGEELGLVFTAGIVLVYLGMFLAVLMKLPSAPARYHCLLTFGLGLFIALQALINMGVVTGLLPTKGMSLPLISYGGSNLLFIAVFIGLILNAFRHWDQPLLEEPREL